MANVAVLGCGPAGMFAAQACALHDLDVTIISNAQQSVIYGAQYLHKPIPGLSPTDSTGLIRTIRVGLPEVYAERVYGLGTMPTSWEKVQPLVDAWDLRQTYAAAWEKFGHRVVDWMLNANDVIDFNEQFDMVINTVPLWAICARPNEHYFKSENILVQKGVDLSGLADRSDNFVIYNGTWEHSWYRASSIFGHTSIEARSEEHLLINKSWEPGFKVVGTDCDCHPEVIRAGRMGTWTRGVLTHNAFEVAIEAIADRFGIEL